MWWALLGAALIVFMAWVIGQWVTGAYFEAVDPGQSEMPDAQGAALVAIQVGGSALALFCIHWTLVRPYLKERVVKSEGLLVLSYGTLYFWDPISNAANYWFLYNANLWNKGSWVNEMPLFRAWGGEPGAMWSEPIFGMGPGYVYFWVIGVWAGTRCFKFVKRRFPQVGTAGALVACYAGIFIFDVVIEAFIWMRTGFFVYPGGRQLGTIFGESYLAFPFIEAALIGVLLTPYVLLIQYKDDKGRFFVERGIDRVKLGSKGKTAVRFLAILAIAHVFYFSCYNIWAYHIGANATEYPREVQQRSHFLNGLCGEGAGRLCPGEAVPNSRGTSAYIDEQGSVSVPPGTDVELPKVVPLDRGKPGPGE